MKIPKHTSSKRMSAREFVYIRKSVLGKTQKEVGVILSRSKPSINGYETGKREIPGIVARIMRHEVEKIRETTDV